MVYISKKLSIKSALSFAFFIDLNDFVQISCIREKRATITYLFFNALSSEVGWLKKILGLFSFEAVSQFKNPKVNL